MPIVAKWLSKPLLGSGRNKRPGPRVTSIKLVAAWKSDTFKPRPS
jgi:hypothetical protein